MKLREQEKRLEVETFNQIAESESYSEAPEEEYHRMFSHLFSGTENPSEMKLLDVGCGSGGNSIRLSRLSFNVSGVDLSPKAIEIAQEKAKKAGISGIEFLVGDIENLDYDDRCFDICFCGAVLHHFPDLDEVAKELYRVTKIGGRLMAYEPNALHPYVFMVHNVINRAVHLKGFSANERALRPKDIRVPFEEAGFSGFRFDSFVLHTKKPQWRFIRETSYRTFERIFSGLRKGNMLTVTCEKRR